MNRSPFLQADVALHQGQALPPLCPEQRAPSQMATLWTPIPLRKANVLGRPSRGPKQAEEVERTLKYVLPDATPLPPDLNIHLEITAQADDTKVLLHQTG